ncbi:MAG: DUF1593 domain-containing protein [Prevotella sp.]|nr:DUF1593 domain-containing protein [Prevotella sp.]
MKKLLIVILSLFLLNMTMTAKTKDSSRLRVIVTTDGEIDDECSLVRFLLYANEWDVEAIVTSSSQYHWHGHNWAGDSWMDNVMKAYKAVYPNLLKHDKNYPSPEYLESHSYLGNVEKEGEMEKETAGSNRIVEVLLDKSDNRPVWIQAWGGTNTIARALKTIQEKYPERMDEVAAKCRFFFIWEQDDTYQRYIRPHWGKYNMLTIISDQFEAIAYRWKKNLSRDYHKYFASEWMRENILNNHGPLAASYKAHNNGDFRSEGDSPAFMYTIATGLDNPEQPGWGGWAGRYVKLRENTWVDQLPQNSGHYYPDGRYWDQNVYSRRPKQKSTRAQLDEYFKPIARWSEAFQNDFAARMDRCIKPFNEVNHEPTVVLKGKQQREAKPGKTMKLKVKASDIDGNTLSYRWWQYVEAGTCKETVAIENANTPNATVTIPAGVQSGTTIHVICEVTDNGTPQLTRYQRVVITNL